MNSDLDFLRDLATRVGSDDADRLWRISARFAALISDPIICYGCRGSGQGDLRQGMIGWHRTLCSVCNGKGMVSRL